MAQDTSGNNPDPDRDPTQDPPADATTHGNGRPTPLPPGVGRAGDRYGDYGFRLGQLIVDSADAGRVRELLPRLPSAPQVRDVSEIAGGFQIFHLATPGQGTDIPQILDELRDLSHDVVTTPLRVAPHHVFWGTSHVRIFRTTVPPAPGRRLRPQRPLRHLPGKGVRVLVVDTPVDVDHPWFEGRVVPLDPASVRAGGPVVGDGTTELPWYTGHGTFVAGIVLQHAPGAQIVHAGRVGEHGEIDDATLAGALLAAVGSVEPCDVVNLSLGGYVHPGSSALVTEAALAVLREKWQDTVVVAAAGNDGLSTPFLPAAAKGVIGVGALDGEKPACFTNAGTWVDACAPGVDGNSTFVFASDVLPQAPDGHPSCLKRPLPTGPVTFDGYAVWSGTSVAAPRVTGAIAAAIVPGTTGARKAAFRLIGAAGLPHLPGLGTVLNPGRW